MHDLGLVLGITHTKLKIMTNSTTFRSDIIAAWLHQEDHVKENGEPSWTVLVNALNSDHVKQMGIADKIAMDKGLT